MGCICTFIIIINVVLWIAADVLMWMYSPLIGIFGICAIIAYIIGCILAPMISLAPRAYWVNSEFGIFIKIITFGNTCALVVWGGLIILASMLGNETALGFIEWASS